MVKNPLPRRASVEMSRARAVLAKGTNTVMGDTLRFSFDQFSTRRVRAQPASVFRKRSDVVISDVCFGSKADIEARPSDVRFTPKADID